MMRKMAGWRNVIVNKGMLDVRVYAGQASSPNGPHKTQADQLKPNRINPRPSKLLKSERATRVRTGHKVPNGCPRTYRMDFASERVNMPPNEGRVARGKDVREEDLSKPFKEKLKTPLTRRIIEFAGLEYVMPTNITLYDGSTDPTDHLNRFSMAANSGEWPMPVWCLMFQQILDGGARGWFESLPLNSINE
ncbi:hypothetical protein Tco_0341131, partial [Tanacetum coccineum]